MYKKHHHNEKKTYYETCPTKSNKFHKEKKLLRDLSHSQIN